MRVRSARDDDLGAIQAIYAHHVLTGFGTFEEVPPSVGEMAARRAAVLAADLPWLVAENETGSGGVVAGYAYAGPFRPRSAYRFTAEDSVYVAPDAQGRGVGRALLAGVIEACEARGLRRLLALIGDSDNAASIGLHRTLGFEPAGVLPQVGFKHGRWLDAVWMQRALTPSEGAPEPLSSRPERSGEPG